MAIERTIGTAARPAPVTAAAQAPKSEPRKPQDNAAASQAPRETRTAVNNAFGKVPMTSGKLVTELPRSPARYPKTANQTAQATPLPTVNPQVQAIFDNRLPEGKTVKEKLDAGTPAYFAKAAQDHYNKQKDAGEQLDAVSRFYLNNTALYMVENGVSQDNIRPDKLAEVLDKERIAKNLEEIGKDPAFLQWASEQQANAIEDTVNADPGIAALIQPYMQEGENHVNALRRMQSDYLSSQDFADAVARSGKDLATEGLKALASLGLGEKEMLGVANTLAENIRAKYTPEAPKLVIDPATNKAAQTTDGFNLAALPDGTFLGMRPDGIAVNDSFGNAYVYNGDGSPRVDARGRYVQYDARARGAYADYDGTRYMIDAAGKGRYDMQGRPLAIDREAGAPVALGADGQAAADAAGRKLVFDPATGKAVTDPASGNAVVIDPGTKGIVQTGADGKVVSAPNGDPYAADRATGAFLRDAAGRPVAVSKANIAPGILPGYVVDGNKSKVVVSPANGKPVVDPRTGRTVILVPDTNAPALVPLDSSGKPQVAEDGKNIVYDIGGNTVVRAAGEQGPNWLVTADGKYAGDGNGHYIGVGAKSGVASPVDAKGAPIENGSGQVPLWDPNANAFMLTADGNHAVVVDKTGSLLMTNKEGQTIVEEKTGLPYLLDPRTLAKAVNVDNGRAILLDPGGAAVEYNADDGYKYLNNPVTNTTVKTSGGQLVTIDDRAGMPVAVNADGSLIKNPLTGNTVVYNLDGKPAVEKLTGGTIEITANGKPHLIDPITQMPFASDDEGSGGLQLYNKDGSELLDPANGNKVQLNANGHRVEVDARTGKFATDAYGNTLVLGPGNTPLKTPAGNPVVVDKQTGSPVAVDAAGKPVVEPKSGLLPFINTDTGKALEDPAGKVAVVVDPKTGAPVRADAKTGAPIKDPATGLTVVANPKTGEQLYGPAGEVIGVLPGYMLPVYYNKQNNTLTVADPQTGKAATNPRTGAQVIIDPQYGVPVEVLPDKAGSLVLVDSNGKSRNDGLGNVLYLDKETGQVVIKLPDGRVVDAITIKAPEKSDPKQTATAIPYPPRFPAGGKVPGTDSSTPAPQEAKGDDAPTEATEPVPPEPTPPEPVKAEPVPEPTPTEPTVPTGVPGPSSSNNPLDLEPPFDKPWFQPGYRTTPDERAEYIKKFKQMTKFKPTYAEEAEAIEELKTLRRNEALKDIPTEDLVAVRSFTRSYFRQINMAVGSNDPAQLAMWETEIKGMMSGLNALEEAGLRYEGPAVRFQQSGMQYPHAFEENSYFRVKQFLSTSSDLDYADAQSIGKGGYKIKFDKVIGVRIDSISHEPDEDEVIVKPGKEIETGSIDDWYGSEASKFYGKKIGKQTTATVHEPEAPVRNEVDNVASTAPPEDEILPDPATTPTPTPSEEILPELEVRPPSPELPPDQPVTTTPAAAKAASRWSAVGSAIGEVIGVGAGIWQTVSGGLQIDSGIRGKNPYDIAAGTLNVTSGALGISAGAASLIGGAVAAAAAPLAGAAAFAGMVALIVDILKHKDDHNKFADTLGEMYGSLDIFKDGWHEKAAQIYYDAHGEPDPAPIAHGNVP